LRGVDTLDTKKSNQLPFFNEDVGLIFVPRFYFEPDCFSSLEGIILTMEILGKKSLRQKSRTEKNSSHMALFFRMHSFLVM
jgi:hypothetical protein